MVEDVNFYDDTHLILYLVPVAVKCEIGFDLDAFNDSSWFRFIGVTLLRSLTIDVKALDVHKN